MSKMPSSYLFEHDLSKASTLPSDWYTSQIILDQEYKNIFSKTWQLVGRLDQVKNIGDFITSKLGRENIVVTRNSSNELNGFINVCRHRAGKVASGCGNQKLFKCEYHGWTYDPAGNLKGAPEFHGVEYFDLSKCKLPKLEVKIFGTLIFASLSPKMTFEEFMGDIPEKLKPFQLEKSEFFLSNDYFVDCNWKVYIDNYLEGYHLPAAHPDLCKELDYSRYKTLTSRWTSEQFAPSKTDAQVYTLGESPESHYYWLFPNMMFNVYQGIIQTNVVTPIGHNRCLVRFDWYFTGIASQKERKSVERLKIFADKIQEEDRVICENVFDNLHSETYTQGRYSVKRENGVHHFHGLLSEFISL